MGRAPLFSLAIVVAFTLVVVVAQKGVAAVVIAPQVVTPIAGPSFVMPPAHKAKASAPGTGFLDGNHLYAECTSADMADVLTCQAYVMGVVDAVNTGRATSPKAQICLPSNLGVKQVMEVVTRYLRDHVRERADAASELITVAVMRAFPCSQ